MSGDQNDKATCSNSSPPHQQEENFVQDNATTSGTNGNTTTSATEAGNMTINATEAGNATTDGTRGKKRKQIRERRLNELSTKSEDVLPINWDDLYDMLNLSELDASILRGYALLCIGRCTIFRINAIILDPHMVSHQSMQYGDKSSVQDYLTNKMDMAFKEKKVILYIYNKSHHWILICINPLDGNVYYFDSYLSATERKFEGVKTFIDSSFTTILSREQHAGKIGYTELTHHMSVMCHQQPTGSLLCGFYVTYHMNIILSLMKENAPFQMPDNLTTSTLSKNIISGICQNLSKFLVRCVVEQEGAFYYPG